MVRSTHDNLGFDWHLQWGCLAARSPTPWLCVALGGQAREELHRRTPSGCLLRTGKSVGMENPGIWCQKPWSKCSINFSSSRASPRGPLDFHVCPPRPVTPDLNPHHLTVRDGWPDCCCDKTSRMSEQFDFQCNPASCPPVCPPPLTKIRITAHPLVTTIK